MAGCQRGGSSKDVDLDKDGPGHIAESIGLADGIDLAEGIGLAAGMNLAAGPSFAANIDVAVDMGYAGYVGTSEDHGAGPCLQLMLLLIVQEVLTEVSTLKMSFILRINRNSS